MGENSTPLASAFFRMVLFGGIMGTVLPPVFYAIGSLTTAFPNPLVVLTSMVFGFFMGMVAAGSAAAPAIGLHTWAAAKTPELCVGAAAFGGAMGPILAVAILVDGSLAYAPIPPIGWALLLPAAALAAMYFTGPLRRVRPIPPEKANFGGDQGSFDRPRKS